MIRRALRNAKDRPIPDTVDGLDFVESANLREDLRQDIASVERLVDSGEWKAACVLAGSALETMLLDAHLARKAEATAAYSELPLGQRKKDQIEKWGLHAHLIVAEQLGILRSQSVKVCDALRAYRNYIHPGRALSEEDRLTRPKAKGCVAGVLLAIEDLGRAT